VRELSHALALAVAAAREAAGLLRAEFHRGPRGDPGHCPADTEAERLIVARLATTGQAILGEETGRSGPAGAWQWLVDPNDGTAAFQRGHRGAAVSIALLHHGLPVLGVVLAHSPPVGFEDCIAWAEGCPLTRNGRPVERRLAGALTPAHTVLVSQAADRLPEANAALVAPARYRPMASIAYRLALVAVGEGEAGVSASSPCGWDFGAGHALLRAVGGELVDEHGRPMRYTDDGLARCRRCVGGHLDVASGLARRDWGSFGRGEPRLAEPGPPVDGPVLARAQGVLLGQLCGDALGAQVEFQSAEEIARAWPGGVREMRDGGGTWGTLAGQPTDDSELALAMARSLLRRGTWDAADILASYRRWFASPGRFDAGHATTTALTGGPPDGWSEANGALMRQAPLGIFGAALPIEETEALARRDAALTHPNPVSLDACAVFVAAVARSVAEGGRPVDIHAFALARCREPAVRRAVEAAAGDGWLPWRFRGDVLFSLHAAFRQILHARTGEEALVEVVGRGGDTDTDAAIAGALYGAVHGVDAFPWRWRDRVLTCRPLLGSARPRPMEFWPVDALIVAERLASVGVRAPG
jgi:ADP-ribosylglycohydrolase/fructose-1,6-bisphosphatase/inositol monophosphatase family enzyme